MLVILDDLHFADEASLTLVQDLLECTVQAPLMFCLLFRPLRDKGCWRLRDNVAANFPHRHTEIAIYPLTPRRAQNWSLRLLPGARLTETVRAEIHDKSAGNPFYIEEVVRSLIDNGAVVRLTAAPGRWPPKWTRSQCPPPSTAQSLPAWTA